MSAIGIDTLDRVNDRLAAIPAEVHGFLLISDIIIIMLMNHNIIAISFSTRTMLFRLLFRAFMSIWCP
jgi:hypothetical protein